MTHSETFLSSPRRCGDMWPRWKLASESVICTHILQLIIALLTLGVLGHNIYISLDYLKVFPKMYRVPWFPDTYLSISSL